MSESAISSMVLDILSKDNRPYAMPQLLDKCGKEVPKFAVQKALDKLVSREEVTVKCFGKTTKLYYIKQRNDLSEHKRALQNCAQKLTQSRNNLKNKQTEYRQLEQQLKQRAGVRSVQSLEAERSQLADEIRALNETLCSREAQVATAEQFTPVAAQKVEQSYEEVTRAYRKRKRMCADMLEAIMEGYPKSKKALIQDIGVETDEEVGFNLEVTH